MPASWSSGNVFVSEAEGTRFKSRGGQIEHNVAKGKGSAIAVTFLQKKRCCVGAVMRNWALKLVTRFGVVQQAL